MATVKQPKALFVVLDPRDLLNFGREVLRLTGRAEQPTSSLNMGDRTRYRFAVAPEHRNALCACAHRLTAARDADPNPDVRSIRVDVGQVRRLALEEAERVLPVEALQLEQKRLRDNEYLPGQGPKNPFN